MSEDDTNEKTSELGYADTETADLILGAARILRRDVTTRSADDSLSRLLVFVDKGRRYMEAYQEDAAELAQKHHDMMRALVEGDAAHAEIVRGLRAERDAARAAATAFGNDADAAREDAERARNAYRNVQASEDREIVELREDRDTYKKLLAACTEQLLANQQALEEATEVITANSALMLDGRDVVADASTVLSDALVNAARYEAKFAEALFERDQARVDLAEEQTKCSERIAELAKAHNEVIGSYERELEQLRGEIAALKKPP